MSAIDQNPPSLYATVRACGTDRPTIVCCAACSPSDSATLPAVVQRTGESVPECYSCHAQYPRASWEAVDSIRPGYWVVAVQS